MAALDQRTKFRKLAAAIQFVNLQRLDDGNKGLEWFREYFDHDNADDSLLMAMRTVHRIPSKSLMLSQVRQIVHRTIFEGQDIFCLRIQQKLLPLLCQ